MVWYGMAVDELGMVLSAKSIVNMSAYKVYTIN